MNPDTLNRLHELRSLSQDLRRKVETDKAWTVAVHLATCETELTSAIALTAGMVDESPPQVFCFVCNESVVRTENGCCPKCLVCLCVDCLKSNAKSSAVITPTSNQSRS